MDSHPLLSHPHARLFGPGYARSLRASSWDRSGGNRDFVTVGPGEVATLLEEEGPGCINHVYCAMVLPDLRDYRNAILRCYWDDAPQPAVEAPLGDFFGVAHGRVREFSSAFVCVNPGAGSSHGLNAYFPMPFDLGARVTLENRGSTPLGGVLQAIWYHIDYELYARPLPPGTGRFHASYRQERATVPVGESPNVTLHDGFNVDGRDNYVALDTRGCGRMVGVALEIENRHPTWYGEGDDMVFVDGERWMPSIHGTGTEEIFGGGACPSRAYSAPYAGYQLVDSPMYEGLVGMYRWYVSDPIHFRTSLRWTIEHGHANNFANGYATVVYWYQDSPARLPPLPTAGELQPPLGPGYEPARRLVFDLAATALEPGLDSRERLRRLLGACQAGEALYDGDWAAACDASERCRHELGLEEKEGDCGGYT